MRHDPSTALTPRAAEAAAALALWDDPSPERAALEAHAVDGCSLCARTLVNALDLAVPLALATSPAPLDPAARTALLGAARRAITAKNAVDSRAFETRAATETCATPAAPHAADRAAPPEMTATHARVLDPGAADHATPLAPSPARARVLDPSAAIAHRHLHDPGEPARIAEIDALAATEPRPGEGTARMLSQVARFLDFSIYFASVVRGERAGYRVQRGLPAELTAFRELRREMSYCTHCVSAGTPFIVEDAAREPFFRGNKAVTRFGVVAYAGVPLRLTTGTILGTLCALDFTPHIIPIGTVRLMEAFARRAVAEIERERAPHLFPELVLAASDRADVHTAAFFVDLVDAARAHSHDTARPLTLLTFRAPGASAVLPWLDENDTAGSLGEGAFGLLLPASDPAVLDERAARLHAGGAEGVALTTAPPEPASPKST